MIGPWSVSKDLSKLVWVGFFDLLHDLLDEYAMVFRLTAQICPMTALGDLKSMKISSNLVVDIFAKLFNGFLLLFIPCIAEALEEEEGKDEVAQVCGIHRATEDVGRLPKPRFDVLLGCLAHVRNFSRVGRQLIRFCEPRRS